MKKKIVSIILSLATIIGSLTSVTAFAYSPSSSEYNVRVLVDGVDIYGNYSGYERPFVMDGYDRTMVPLRPIFETLGGSAAWDATTMTATCSSGRDNVGYRFTVDSYNLELLSSETGEVSTVIGFDAPSVLVGDHIYIPIRAFCEAAGFSITWDEATSTVGITTGSSGAETYITNSVNVTLSKAIELVELAYGVDLTQENYTVLSQDENTIEIYRPAPENEFRCFIVMYDRYNGEPCYYVNATTDSSRAEAEDYNSTSRVFNMNDELIGWAN